MVDMRAHSTDPASDLCVDGRRIWSLESPRTPFGQAGNARRRSAWWLRNLVLILGLTLGLSGQLPADAAAQSDDTEASGDGSAGYTTLDSVQLATMLQNRDFFFVNVHIPYEGEIEGTDALIAFDKIADNLD